MTREGGNYWTTELVNNAPIPSNSVPSMMHDIHVLLVDHDIDSLINTAKQLEMMHYKVTYAEQANHAATFLGKSKIDVVMANINFPGANGFKLLQHAVNMCIPVVWMADDENAMLSMMALENGAFICLKRPLTTEFIRCLWQHVIREKTRMIRDRDMFIASNNLGPRGGADPFKEVHDVNVHLPQNPKPNPNVPMMTMRNTRKRSGGRLDDWYDEDIYDSDNTMTTHDRRRVKRKMCIEWTQELHAKFMDAVEQLGDGSCFPKQILELMNESGLTRMQVASHLQKCRNDNWRSPEQRRPSHQTSQNSTPNGAPQSKPRSFGAKPWVERPSSSHIRPKTRKMGQSSRTHWETREPNNEPKMGHDLNNNSNYHPNPRHESDEFFNFPDMDCLIHEFSGGQQVPETNNLSPTREGYQVHSAYNDDQNSGEASMKNKSQ